MTLQDIGIIVAVLATVVAAVAHIISKSARVGAWIEQRKEQEGAWSAQDRRLGQLTDRTQAALTHIERDVQQTNRDLVQHMRDDSDRFLEISGEFGSLKSSLARIEGALGTKPQH